MNVNAKPAVRASVFSTVDLRFVRVKLVWSARAMTLSLWLACALAVLCNGRG